MRLKDNPTKGKRVWLSDKDRNDLMGELDSTEKRIAMRLMLDSGLRTKEVLRARLTDIRPMDDSDGHKLRVWEGKGDQYRETWIPADLVSTIRTYVDMSGLAEDDLLVDVTRQSLQRWIRNARGALEERTDDEGWQYVTAHDLRRTWGTNAIEANMAPTVVMQCGGWQDFETFQEHYMGQHGDQVIAKEAGKVLG